MAGLDGTNSYSYEALQVAGVMPAAA